MMGNPRLDGKSRQDFRRMTLGDSAVYQRHFHVLAASAVRDE